MSVKEFIIRPSAEIKAVEDFYTEFSNALSNHEIDIHIYHLENITFIEPILLLTLITTTQVWYKKSGHATNWKCSEELAQYLHRLDVFKVLGNAIYIEQEITEIWSRGANKNLLELTPLRSDHQNNAQDVSRLLESCMDLFLGRVRQKQIGSLITLVSEISQNIVHSKTMGHTFMQVYDERRIHIVVSDTGIGIQTSLLPKYPAISEPSAYIQKALESGVTSRHNIGGNGLYEVQKLVTEAGGTLIIRSGTGLLTSLEGKIYRWDNLVNIPGTQVYIAIWGLHQPPEWNYLLP